MDMVHISVDPKERRGSPGVEHRRGVLCGADGHGIPLSSVERAIGGLLGDAR